MLKVFRKYNKYILVVGGTLLLIAFLMPQAISQMGKARMGRSVGTIDGQKISASEYQSAVMELVALEGFFGHLDRQLPMPLEEGREREHWMLLRHEAEQAGLVGGSREGETLLPVFADAMVRQVYVDQARRQFGGNSGQIADFLMSSDPDGVQEMTQRAMQILADARVRAASLAQMTGPQFDKALARLQGVSRLINTYQRAERLSDRETAAIAKALADSALVDAVFLSGRDLADKTLEPTQEELREHFERFRSFGPGEGEFGVGYKLPQRVKIEWIELDRSQIEDAVRVSMLDATKHWQQNRDKFPGEFEAEREAVQRELRDAKVARVMNTAESVLKGEVARATRPLDRDGDYRVLPGDWSTKRPGLSALSEQIVQTVKDAEGVEIPTPSVQVRSAEWLDFRRLNELEGIGTAMIRIGAQSATFPQVALAVRELAGDSSLALQEGVTAIDLPATSREGDRYYFTILASAEAEVPGSIEELLDSDRIVDEWRAVRQYESFANDLPTFEQRVAQEGLEAFAASFGTIEPETNEPETDEPESEEAADPEAPAETEGTQAESESGEELAEEDADAEVEDAAADESEPDQPEPQPRVNVIRNARVYENRTQGLLRAENTQSVIDAVLARAAQIDPLRPIDEVPTADRVISASVPSSLGVIVAQVNGVQPLTRQLLPAYADGAQQQRWQETVGGGGLPYPYQLESLRARHAFVMRDQDDDEEIPGAPAESTETESEQDGTEPVGTEPGAPEPADGSEG